MIQLSNFPSALSHTFSASLVIFFSSISCLLAAYSSKSLVTYTTYLLQLLYLHFSFHKTLTSPVSSHPFLLLFSLSLHVSLHCLTFFCFLCLHTCHKYFFCTLTQSDDSSILPCFSCCLLLPIISNFKTTTTINQFLSYSLSFSKIEAAENNSRPLQGADYFQVQSQQGNVSSPQTAV